MSEFVVYTAVTRGYDALRSPPELWRGHARFVAFQEAATPGSEWEHRPIYRRFRDPCRNAKIHKILSHKYFPEAKYSLWVDGSIRIKSTLPIEQWAGEFLGQHDLAVFKHRYRKCCYEEAQECLQAKRDPFAVINRQMQKYFEDGYPPNNGLGECTILLRRHSRLVARFNEMWYAEIKAHSRRDQLSFNYVAHKVGLKYQHLPGLVSNNAHFEWLAHTGPRFSTVAAE